MSKLTPPDTSIGALFKLAGPIFVANAAIIGSGTIDTIMAGQLGKEHLSAIALGIAATISVLMGLVGIVNGLSPICGHHYGARKFHLIGEELNQSFWLALCLLAIGIPIIFNTDFWIELGQAKGEVARMAAEYMIWTALSLPACLANRTFIAVNAAVSKPRVTMWISLAMLALKAPLNAIFMYGWLGFPAMGGSGAGISFFILSNLSFLAYVFIWKKDPFYKDMQIKKFKLPQWSRIKEQLHVGIPIGLSTFFEVSSFTLMAIFVSRFGPQAMSAHQIVSNMTSMCYMIPLSIGIASSVLISQCLGARWPNLSFMVLKRSLLMAIGIALSLSLFLFFARDIIIDKYTSDEGVFLLACQLILFGCCYHVFDAMQTVSSFCLRGYRVTKLPMIIYGVMLWGVGLGLGYYAAFHAERFGGPFGVYGFWTMTSVGLFLTGISLAVMALYVGYQFSKENEKTLASQFGD